MNLRDVDCCAATGLENDKFVGIRIGREGVEFHYPVTFDLAKDDGPNKRKDILSVLRSIELTKTLTKDNAFINTSRREENGFPLHAFLWIIEDYLAYGTYVNREKMYVDGAKGRISWKRTLRGNPAFSQGNVVYTKIVSERKNQADNLLTEIYFFCVFKSMEAIGWIFNLSFDSKGVDYNRLFNRKKYLSALNDELCKTFDDVKRIRLSKMKDVILGLDEDPKTNKQLVYGVDSYEYVFERMIDMMFSRVERKKDFYPNAFWCLDNPPEEKKSSNLRPDTIAIADKKVFILDAKYYRYGVTFEPDDLPETTSIQKQITYGEFVKKVKAGEFEEVFNAFLMPYSKKDNKRAPIFSKNIECIGIAKAAWPKGTERHHNIVGILIDTRFLLENWMSRDEPLFWELTEMIEKRAGGFKC